MVVLLSMIVHPTPGIQITLSKTPKTEISMRFGLNVRSCTLQNKGPVPEDKEDYNPNYPFVLGPNCYTAAITMSGKYDEGE